MKNNIKRACIYLPIAMLSIVVLSACGAKKAQKSETKTETTQEVKHTEKVSFSYSEIEGIGKDPVYNRRDPSDIIKVGNKYYIWYTRMDKPVRSGYWGTIWYATSEDEGHTWKEQGMALGLGKEGTFDSHSVFTPNILAYKGKYYMYYTGVQPTPGNPNKEFEGNSTTDFTAIGVAVADSPEGPFKRPKNNVVIAHSEVSSDFDSYRVDDASLLVKDGKIWLYYKGRCIEHGKKGAHHTQMGVAIAENPEGPFKKYDHPLIEKGHEVLIWNQNGGVASLASLSKSIHWAKDGLDFSPVAKELTTIPMAPGLYRPHLEDGNTANEVPGWGICMRQSKGEAHLFRYEINNASF
ncbi:family 43 glycosylhydrolase [Polaribacter sargassicola]|uniref:family 43 glycosylhydrolase n=1 Tax=Polaribacter sargassicola TaxID=2836891 RepID=UPI001F025AE1|nr:family 43 glycosylhydrolase [Polaribacter sp. DS7-9]MCG1035796.1 family 43 glycosylhydrolase [Polaribacter sp. DS7-9]